jgi:hypothetical protein
MSLYSVSSATKPYTQVVGNMFVIAFLTDTTIAFNTDIPRANVLVVSPGTNYVAGQPWIYKNYSIRKNANIDIKINNIATQFSQVGYDMSGERKDAPFLPSELKGLRINGAAVDKFSRTGAGAKPNSGNPGSTGIVLIYWDISDIINKYKDIQDADSYIKKQLDELYQVPGSGVDTMKQQYEGAMMSGAFFTVMATCLAYYVFYQL